MWFCSKITGRVNDPPLQVWLVIWRAKQQFVQLSTKNDPCCEVKCSTDRLYLYSSFFTAPFFSQHRTFTNEIFPDGKVKYCWRNMKYAHRAYYGITAWWLKHKCSVAILQQSIFMMYPANRIFVKAFPSGEGVTAGVVLSEADSNHNVLRGKTYLYYSDEVEFLAYFRINRLQRCTFALIDPHTEPSPCAMNPLYRVR